jgi:CheY-like chemotaxis protein
MLLTNKRIFILEDDVHNLAIMSTMLRDQGAVVRFERWGVGTTEVLRDFLPVDIILLDLMLPKQISGYDVYDQIRAMPEMADVPIVLVTAANADAEMKRSREKGFNGFIPKPLRFGRFSKQVLAIIDGEEIWGE